MANEFVVLFDDVKTWFAKVWQKAPADATAALAVWNKVAPDAELIFAEIDPAAAVVVNPIVNTITADMGTVATVLQQGGTSIGSFLTAIANNFKALLTAGHISSTSSVTKANGILAAIEDISKGLGL